MSEETEPKEEPMASKKAPDTAATDTAAETAKAGAEAVAKPPQPETIAGPVHAGSPLQVDGTFGGGDLVQVKLAPRVWVLSWKVGDDGKGDRGLGKGYRHGRMDPTRDDGQFAWVDAKAFEENPHIGELVKPPAPAEAPAAK